MKIAQTIIFAMLEIATFADLRLEMIVYVSMMTCVHVGNV